MGKKTLEETWKFHFEEWRKGKGKSSISYNNSTQEELEEYYNRLMSEFGPTLPPHDGTELRKLPIPPNSLVADFAKDLLPPIPTIHSLVSYHLKKLPKPPLHFLRIPELEAALQTPASKRIEELKSKRKKLYGTPEDPPPEKKQRLLTDDQVKLAAQIIKKGMAQASARLEAAGGKSERTRLDELAKSLKERMAADPLPGTLEFK